MSKKSKQKSRGGAKAYSSSTRQTSKGAAKSFAQTSGRARPDQRLVWAIRIIGIVVNIAAVAGALVLAVPGAGDYPTSVVLFLLVLAVIAGLALFVAFRAPRVAEWLNSVQKR